MQASDPPGMEGFRGGDIREVLPEWTPKPNPKGSVPARQEKARKWQPGRENRQGEDGGRTRLLVLAEACGKETAFGLVQWAKHGREAHPSSETGGPLHGRR